jgi:hypothetical protein
MRPENQSTTNYELRTDEVWKSHRPAWNDGHLNFQMIRTIKPVGKDGGAGGNDEGRMTNDETRSPDVGTPIQKRQRAAAVQDGGTSASQSRVTTPGKISFHHTSSNARY